jgi:hypothetical protein
MAHSRTRTVSHSRPRRRILDEAHATQGDVRRLADLFGLSIQAGTRYVATVDDPDLTNESDTAER